MAEQKCASVLVRGVGDVGSAVAAVLFRAGYSVALHDEPAPVVGVLRGLTRNGVEVTVRAKVTDVDPCSDPAAAFGLGERPRRIAEGVLKALATARALEPS